MDSRGIKALLLGESARSSFQLLQWLDNIGCQCRFASTYREACTLISQMAFELVISQLELPDRTAYPLLDWLRGSTATLFFSKTVENALLVVSDARTGQGVRRGTRVTAGRIQGHTPERR